MRVKLLAITALISGVLVLLGWFTLPVRVAMLAILTALAWRSFKRQAPSFKQSFRSACSLQLVACSSAAFAAAILLWSSGTTDPLRSPWSVVPIPFFFLYALLAALCCKIPFVSFRASRASREISQQYDRGLSTPLRSARDDESFLSPFSISITLALSALVGLLVYPLGFGFDHFIHAAAERIIATTGALSPPPFFYSGHYGLTVLLADLLPGVGVDLADRLLTPLLTIILLVPLAYRSLISVLPDHVARFGLSSLLIVPFLPLAVSTPQATANVFALATVLLLMERSQSIFSPLPDRRGSVRGWSAPVLTSAAALLSQPMTGIMTIATVLMALVWRWTRKTRSRFSDPWLSGALTTVLAIGSAIAIPLAFTVAGRIMSTLDLRVAFDPLPALQRLGSALHDALTFTAVDFATADALAVARVLLPMLWTGLAVAGALTRGVTMFSRPLKHGDTAISVSNVRSSQSVLMLVSTPLMALAAAALVAATVTIPTQLGEEQSQFPLRLVQLAALLATPLAAVGLGTLLSNVLSPSLRRGDSSREASAEWGRGRSTPWHLSLAMALIFGTLATFNLLLAYPRDDAQARSGLWSVSADDIAAVHAIENDASDASAGAGGDAPYVVLANQMLGAAAIHEFGFRPAHRLMNGQEVLAFPLPAGGLIARKYWEFVSQDFSQCFSPSRREGEREGVGLCLPHAPVDAAMSLVNVHRAYVVLHDYWRNYERLAAATAGIADAELSPLPHLRIFRFERRP